MNNLPYLLFGPLLRLSSIIHRHEAEEKKRENENKELRLEHALAQKSESAKNHNIDSGFHFAENFANEPEILSGESRRNCDRQLLGRVCVCNL